MWRLTTLSPLQYPFNRICRARRNIAESSSLIVTSLSIETALKQQNGECGDPNRQQNLDQG